MQQTAHEDKKWFEANPDRHFYCRMMAEDEFGPTAKTLGLPSEGLSWRVIVFKLSATARLRFPVLIPDNWRDDPPEQIMFYFVKQALVQHPDLIDGVFIAIMAANAPHTGDEKEVTMLISGEQQTPPKYDA